MEKWTLESAIEDYCKEHNKKKKKEEKDCMYCKFAEFNSDADVICQVKDKVIVFFTGFHAKRCKYFTSRIEKE